LKTDPVCQAVVGIAVKEGVSIDEVIKRGAQDLKFRLAYLNMKG